MVVFEVKSLFIIYIYLTACLVANFKQPVWCNCEPGSSVSIVFGYGLDDRSIDPRQRRNDFSCSLCPDRLWGLPSLLYSGYRGLFPRG
jgi:hypothetical protein